ncbi:MAG: hypothetical protein WDW36_003762 [Sanguina aurantia]
MTTSVHEKAAVQYGAFYSSVLGGITTNPAFMCIPMDDHMVHRGHGVFDTALITDGHLYQLPEHLSRLAASAGAVGLDLPLSVEAMARIILDTAAASNKVTGIVKFWVSAGPGGFGISSTECDEAHFYVVATSSGRDIDRLEGWTAITSTIPVKPKPFACVKSNNYLQNVLVQMQAETDGCDVGLFCDQDGFVAEGPNNNIGIITQDNVLVTPPFDECLPGITLSRLLELIPREREISPNDMVVTRVEQRRLHLSEVMAAKEVFLVGSSVRVVPIVSINGTFIEDGTPGTVTLAMDYMIANDMQVEGSDQHIQIPYGYATGMRSQLR